MLAVVLVEVTRVGGWLERALLFVLGPIAAAFVHLLLSPKREFEADRVAAGALRLAARARRRADPPRAGQRARRFEASPATEPLYTVNPFAEEGLAALFVTHPPLERRLEALRAGSPGSSDHIVTSRRSPRCSIQARSTPSRVKPHFSATRSDATLPGNVPSCIAAARADRMPTR